MTLAPQLLLIGSNNPTTWIVYNHLVQQFGLFDVLIEKPVSKRLLLRNRVRKLGMARVVSQIAFVLLVRPLLLLAGRRRIKTLQRQFGLEPRAPLTAAIHNIDSINSPQALALIQARNPKVIIVNGTRIVKREILNGTKATFINTHQGITPLYRGAHGAYWALHEGDPAHCGVTVHLVDEGIDTGGILGQKIITPEKQDNFATYPYLQTAAALEILVSSVTDALDGKAKSYGRKMLKAFEIEYDERYIFKEPE